jgi:quinol monooxygenase YgiN
MGTHVSWLLEVAVKPDKIATLAALIDDVVASTRDEPGSLSFEFFVDDDCRIGSRGVRCVVGLADLVDVSMP